MEGDAAQVDSSCNKIDELFQKVEEIEQSVNKIGQFYAHIKTTEKNSSRSTSTVKEKEKHIPGMRKLQQDASRRESAAAKRMQELMRQFGSIIRQITQHKWAWPFLQPVNVEALGLDDYYQIIDRPMDFSTVKNQMEATKDGTGYKHVREICSDVMLIFQNAMKYNDEASNVHSMAKNLLDKFEEKWKQFLPKVEEEEKRREEEEAEAQRSIQLAHEAAFAESARDLSIELFEVDARIEELRQSVVKKCRRFTSMEKRKLGIELSKLSTEDLCEAMEMVAQENDGFQLDAEHVELDINAQSETTLWRLKFFVEDAMKDRVRSSGDGGGNNIAKAKVKGGKKCRNNGNAIFKMKRQVCNAPGKSTTTTTKKSKNKPSL